MSEKIASTLTSGYRKTTMLGPIPAAIVSTQVHIFTSSARALSPDAMSCLEDKRWVILCQGCNVVLRVQKFLTLSIWTEHK